MHESEIQVDTINFMIDLITFLLKELWNNTTQYDIHQ